MIRTISLARRRVAVVLQLLSYPLTFGLTSLSGLLASVATLIALGAFLGSFMYLYYQTGLWQFGNAPDKDLDERQVQIRNQAYRFAYVYISTLLILALMYAMLAQDFYWPLPTGANQVNTLFWSFFFVVITLPSAILAWTEPEV
jgi:hypothetical protein